MNLMEISDLCLGFSSPMYAGLPNLDFIVMTTFCSWYHFYRDYFETHEHSTPVLFDSDLVNQKAFFPTLTPASERYLSIYLVSVENWVLDYAQRHLNLASYF